MRILAEASSILVQVIHVEKSISKCVKYVCSASIYAPRVWMLRRLILRLHSFWVMTCVMELPTKSYRPGPRHRNKSVGRHVTVRRTSTVLTCEWRGAVEAWTMSLWYTCTYKNVTAKTPSCCIKQNYQSTRPSRQINDSQFRPINFPDIFDSVPWIISKHLSTSYAMKLHAIRNEMVEMAVMDKTTSQPVRSWSRRSRHDAVSSFQQLTI